MRRPGARQPHESLTEFFRPAEAAHRCASAGRFSHQWVLWVAIQLLAVLAPPAAFCQQAPSDLSEGAAVYAQHCAECHGPNGEGVNAFISRAGPSLKAAQDRGAVAAIVVSGKDVMPTFSRLLTVPQIFAVADYVTQKIATVSLAGGDIAHGGDLFRVYCAPCHRTAVRGGILAFAGVNPPSLVGVGPISIYGSVRAGAGAMPAFPPSILDDKQLASVIAYIQFAKNPPSPGGTPMDWFGPVAEGFVAWIMVLFLVGITGWIEKGGKG